ncbi:MAG TPA: EpsI family protein, partial [Alphaproteobacteria bacterium]|nr:EpsI family protein [Alphaproteobacteria bacterium]
LIRLPSADYRVDEACAGLRFLLVSVAAGVLTTRLFLRSWPRRLLFLAVAAMLPLAANALRSALLIWLAARGMLDPASAALHLTYGLGFTSLMLIFMMMLAWCLRETPTPPEPVPMASRRSAPPLQILAAALAIALLAFLPGTITASPSPPVGPPRLATPSVGGGWTQEALSAELLEKAALAGANASLAAAWSSEDARIELLILYYRRERQGAEAVGADLPSPLAASWTEIDARRARISLGDGRVETLARYQERAGARRIVWTWYWADGRFTGNAFIAKLRQIAARLLRRPDASARLQLALSGPAAQGDPQMIVDRFLADLGPIGPLLEQASPPAP